MADGVVALLAAFTCAADLLRCTALPTPDAAFDDMPACRAAAAEIASPSAAWEASGPVVMARCRYALVDPGRGPTRRSVAAAR